VSPHCSRWSSTPNGMRAFLSAHRGYPLSTQARGQAPSYSMIPWLPLGLHLCPNTPFHRHRIQRKTDALACCARVTPITGVRRLVSLDFTGSREYSFFCVSLTVSESPEDMLCSYRCMFRATPCLASFVRPPPLHFRSHLSSCRTYM
jgi:hypothetical protein